MAVRLVTYQDCGSLDCAKTSSSYSNLPPHILESIWGGFSFLQSVHSIERLCVVNVFISVAFNSAISQGVNLGFQKPENSQIQKMTIFRLLIYGERVLFALLAQ